MRGPQVLERHLAAELERGLADRDARWYHPYDSRRSVVGWPDYAIIAGLESRQLLFLELKKAGGSPTASQAAWLLDLAAAGQVAILAGGSAGVSSVLALVDGIGKGRRLMPSALGRVLVFGDVSPSGVASVR